MRRDVPLPPIRALFLSVAALMALTPLAVAAHAELDGPTPADGAIVAGPPGEVSGTFTQDLDLAGSSMQLRDAAGEVIAKGAPDREDVRRMVIADLPDLGPGAYEVRWTTLSSEDGELARGTWSFTVAATPTPSPSPRPTPTATVAASVIASPAGVPSDAATPASTPTSTTTTAATPAPGDAGASGATAAEAVIPIVVGLAFVVVAAIVLMRRRRRGV